MFGEWDGRAVQDLQAAGVLLVEDGNHGEQRPLAHEFNPTGRPFVRPDDLKFGRVDFGACDRINDDAVRRVRKGHGRPRDVLFTHRATVGRMALVEDDAPLFVANPGVTVWRTLDPEVLDHRFLYYWMQGQDFMRQVWAVAGSTDTFPYVSLTEQRRLFVAVPPIAEQLRISALLATLDDKIGLNRRMNTTLEAMARAVFEDWFVRFGPVRAKAEGRAPPGLAPALAALFPSSLTETRDAIPVGWRTLALGQLLQVARGLSYSGDGLDGDGRPLHNLNSIFEGGGYKRAGIKRYKGPFAERHIVKAGDLIVANTEQGHDRLLIGYAAIVPACFGEEGLFSQHIYRVRPAPNSPVSTYWLYHLLNSRRCHTVVSGYANGSTVNMLPLDALQKPAFATPPGEVIEAFDRIVRPMHEGIERNLDECESLAALRDLILPRLVSGKLRLRDAERALEAAL